MNVNAKHKQLYMYAYACVCDIFWNTIGRFEVENCNDEPNHNYEKESFKRYFSISYKNTMYYIQYSIESFND